MWLLIYINTICKKNLTLDLLIFCFATWTNVRNKNKIRWIVTIKWQKFLAFCEWWHHIIPVNSSFGRRAWHEQHSHINTRNIPQLCRRRSVLICLGNETVDKIIEIRVNSLLFGKASQFHTLFTRKSLVFSHKISDLTRIVALCFYFCALIALYFYWTISSFFYHIIHDIYTTHLHT